jgi:hypothetical protein
MARRGEVLRVYRQVLQLARSWKAVEADQTATEQAYIRAEATRLFRKNQHLTDDVEIKQCIDEATSRIALAKHYGIPYPRLMNVAPNTVMASRHRKRQVRTTKQAKPVYLNSQDQ